MPLVDFENQLEILKKAFKLILQVSFPDLKPSHLSVMASKLNGINYRPLKWKLDRFIKKFNVSIESVEIERFIKIRNSLAHSALFPDDEDNKESFLFMRHFLDRIVLGVLGYSGNYYDMENREEKSLLGN